MTAMELTPHEETLITLSRQLDDDAFEQLLTYARVLKSRPDGEPGWKFIQAARELNWSKADLETIAKAIEDTFEQPAEFSEVNLDE